MSCPREAEPERTDAREAAVALAHCTRHVARGVEVVARDVDVERDERRPRPDQDAARPLVELRRAEVRHQLPAVHAPLQLGRAAAPEERRPKLLGKVGVEEDRQRELLPDTPGKLERGRTRALGVGLPDRRQRDDVRGADARVRALVTAQVDPLARGRDPGEQRGDELLLAANERVDRPVVVLVRVHIEQPGVRRERLADRLDRRAVAPLGEVRHGLERQHRDGPYAPPR